MDPSTLSDEEKALLQSIGLLDLVQEANKTNVNALSHQTLITNKDNSTSIVRGIDPDVTSSTKASLRNGNNLWIRLNSFFKRPQRHTEEMPSIDRRVDENESILYEQSTLDNISPNKVMLGIGGTLFLLPHLAVLLSLPPVLRRRGAPYLPTFKSKLNVMFDMIRAQVQQRSILNRKMQFVDLGSGDGRVVFRAAREGMFNQCHGYEINPTLHLFAQTRKMITPKYWRTARFECGDLWKIQLRKYDVVAVYGLNPIMERLGAKMKQELKPGSIVVSNVFEIPGWRSIISFESEDGSTFTGKGIYLYKVPECFGAKSKTTDKNKDAD